MPFAEFYPLALIGEIFDIGGAFPDDLQNINWISCMVTIRCRCLRYGPNINNTGLG